MLDTLKEQAKQDTLDTFPNDVQANYIKRLENAILSGHCLSGNALDAFIEKLVPIVTPRRKIQIIVLVRMVALLGLKEAKDLVDAACRRYLLSEEGERLYPDLYYHLTIR